MFLVCPAFWNSGECQSNSRALQRGAVHSMRSFRARRQGSQWGIGDQDGWAMDAPMTPGSPFDDVSPGGPSAPADGLRRGESLANIMLPSSEDRELNGGRLVNEEAIYNMRKKWISDRLIERCERAHSWLIIDRIGGGISIIFFFFNCHFDGMP